MAHTPPGRTRERIFRFVRERLLAGHPPTVREVQAAFGFRAPASAREQLEALVGQGRLAKEPGRSRGYRLPARHERAVLVPVLGRVQAGALTQAIEEAEGFVAVSSRLPSKELFALRVCGDSMKDAAILDGDLVIVRRHARAESGRIVVALVGDEATVKTLRIRPGRRGGRVELHPANPAYAPIVFDPAGPDVEILGPVIEVRRELDEGRR
jgi:repressor LexA